MTTPKVWCSRSVKVLGALCVCMRAASPIIWSVHNMQSCAEKLPHATFSFVKRSSTQSYVQHYDTSTNARAVIPELPSRRLQSPWREDLKPFPALYHDVWSAARLLGHVSLHSYLFGFACDQSEFHYDHKGWKASVWQALLRMSQNSHTS